MAKLTVIKKVKCIKKNFGKTEITIGKTYDVYEVRGSVLKIKKDNGKVVFLSGSQFK